MSVINQVLIDLEKRGAAGRRDEPAIRPVARKTSSHKLLLPAAALFALGGAALWLVLRHEPAVPLAAARHQTPEDAGQGWPPASRLSMELSAVPAPAREHEKQAAPVRVAASERKVEAVGGAAAVSAIAVPVGSVSKQIRQPSPQQLADEEFRKALSLMRQGHAAGAMAGYEAVLRLDADHEAARQALAGLLLDGRRNADAERVLREGLERNPRHGGFAMLLARLQVERGDLPQALETLQATLPYAAQQADYLAFVAAVEQRMARHQEAAAHYQTALQLAPGSGLWLMGWGISLQALHRNDEARDAFQRAIGSHTLSAELQAFVKQRLKEL